ncbi:MAG: hypothetical protein F6K47_24935 [Symploca sp. SIO2E6]|nr:hypothetical protein [Symploca sp. SIO2E6]
MVSSFLTHYSLLLRKKAPRQKALRKVDLFLVFFLGRKSLKMLITHYSLLITHYSLLITYYLLLIQQTLTICEKLAKLER